MEAMHIRIELIAINIYALTIDIQYLESSETGNLKQHKRNIKTRVKHPIRRYMTCY